MNYNVLFVYACKLEKYIYFHYSTLGRVTCGGYFVTGELHIRILLHNYLEISKTWNSQNIHSTYWRVYINNADGAELVLPRGRYPLVKNRGHLVPAWTRFGLHNSRTIKHFYFHFDLMGLSNDIHRKIFERPFTLKGEVYFDALVSSVMDLRGEIPRLCRVKSMVYDYLTELFNGLSVLELEEVSQSLLAQSRFASTLQYIENHLAHPLTNEFLAEISDMSESHFAFCFKNLLGQTPAQYVLQRRIAWAAEQLVFTRNSIDAIAEQAGFANRFHFSRQFRRYLGTPPAAYRKFAHGER